ncbi:MAG: type III-A CRISPR-associated RAMP protein Csm5, partial [Methanosarcinales archaeon]
MKYEIKTYTPLHIGTGNKYSKAEYTLKNDILHRVSLDKLLAFLNTIEIKEFTQDLENPSFRLYDFIKNKGIDIKKIKRYTAELKSRTPRDIVEQIKVNDMPYVPGSSIKGAIRTAILYKLFSSKDFNSIKDLLRIGNPRVRNQKLDLYFQNKLSNQNKKNLANYSIMKFIQITDTNTINSRRRCLLVYCTKTLEVFERGSCEWYSRYGRDVEVYLETIPENTILNGSFCFQNEISKTDLTQ